MDGFKKLPKMQHFKAGGSVAPKFKTVVEKTTKVAPTGNKKAIAKSAAVAPKEKEAKVDISTMKKGGRAKKSIGTVKKFEKAAAPSKAAVKTKDKKIAAFKKGGKVKKYDVGGTVTAVDPSVDMSAATPTIMVSSVPDASTPVPTMLTSSAPIATPAPSAPAQALPAQTPGALSNYLAARPAMAKQFRTALATPAATQDFLSKNPGLANIYNAPKATPAPTALSNAVQGTPTSTPAQKTAITNRNLALQAAIADPSKMAQFKAKNPGMAKLMATQTPAQARMAYENSLGLTKKQVAMQPVQPNVTSFIPSAVNANVSSPVARKTAAALRTSDVNYNPMLGKFAAMKDGGTTKKKRGNK